MGNKSSAIEWLVKAWHDLSSARILYAAHHYTDTISIDLQQAIEKSLKSFLAYENKPIKKTHNLIELCELVSDHIQFDESQIRMLGLVTTFYLHDRYPTSGFDLPSRDQIKDVLDFAEKLFETVCGCLEIDRQEVTR
jgi:HEPN domain-containing protein